MFVSTLCQSQRVESLHPLFKQLFDYVKSHDLLHADLGRIEIDGDNLFINNVNPTCVSAKNQPLEAHKSYIDIHILLDGKESIGWKITDDCSCCTKSYTPEDDCALYSDAPTCFVNLLPEQFCIVYPEDAHAPIIGEGKIRKLIAKVKI